MINRLIAAGFLSLTLVSPAAAQQARIADEGVRAAPVRYSDLDLSAPEDAATLLARLRQAADATCAQPEIARPGATLQRAIETCRAETLAAAVDQLDRDEVTRQYTLQVAHQR